MDPDSRYIEVETKCFSNINDKILLNYAYKCYNGYIKWTIISDYLCDNK